MSYQRETDSILTGSLNLLAPGDALPPEDALCLRNWRVDQSGALRSRLDQSSLGTFSPGPIHSIHYRGTHRYVGSGTYLYRDSTQLSTGLDGNPVGFANMNGYCFIMNRNYQKRDDGATLINWGLVQPTVAPTTSGQPGGELAIGVTYQYFVTFLNAQGEETSGSPFATYVPNNPNQFVFVYRPTSPDPSYTQWRVYRLGNNLQQAYAIDPTPYPLSQAYAPDDGGWTQGGVDVTFHSDASLEQLGIVMPTNNDPPPAASGTVGPYYDRLLAWSTASNPNWLFWSKQLQPYAFPGSATLIGNHTPVGDDDDPILVVLLHARQARIYKLNSIWRLAGDPEDPNAVLEITAPDIGLASVTAIDTVGDLDYFEGSEGIYVSNGYTAQKLSTQLDPLFKGDAIPLPGSEPALPLNLAYRVLNTLAVRNRRLYFSYAAQGSSVPRKYLRRWRKRSRAGTSSSSEWTKPGGGPSPFAVTAPGTVIGSSPASIAASKSGIAASPSPLSTQSIAPSPCAIMAAAVKDAL